MPFLISLGVGFVLTPLLGLVGTRIGLVDRPSRDLKIHQHPIPVTGGWAILIAMVVGGSIARRPGFAELLVPLGLALVVGSVDDVRSLAAWLRLFALTAIAVWLVASGVELGTLVTWAAVGAVMVQVSSANALNMLDGQDLLAGGITAIAAGGAWVIAPQDVLAPTLTGAVCGFLAWNRPPARIFLGDSGAYALGLILGLLGTRAIVEYGWRGFFATGALLIVPACEVIFTLARRLLLRVPMTDGDRLHSYDLIATRYGRLIATYALWTIGAVGAGVAVAVVRLGLVMGAALVAALYVTVGSGLIGLWRSRVIPAR